MKNDIEILDCTFRDGGYYNNWNFNNNIIQDYITDLNKLNIKFIEIGFRTFEDTTSKGETGYSRDRFINKLKVPKNIFLGVMINASDLISKNNDPLEKCKQMFANRVNSKIKFIRFACHFHEIFYLKKTISWLKKNDLKVFINVMQISEISKKKVKEICNFLKFTRIDGIYLADSLGSLNPQRTKNLVKTFKTHWKHDLGFHAHNNLGLAMKNALAANNNGVKWIDCTLMGMGRGPGNLLTEDIIKYLKVKNSKSLFKKKVVNYFFNLKKKYKWGPNKYYAIAAKNKIHPTYIQRMLSDHRYNKLNYLNIIKSLKKTKTSKYNPTKYFQYSFFSNTGAHKANNIYSQSNSNKILIIGSGKSVAKNKLKIEKFILKNNVFVLALNTVEGISEKLINLRVACHPMRIISDISIYKKNKFKNLVLPFYSFNKNIKNLIRSYGINFYHYGLKLSHDGQIIPKKNFCVLPNPLAVGYALSISSSIYGKNVYFAGFDGFDSSNPGVDNTWEIINYFSKKIIKRKPITITNSKYKNLFKLKKI